MDTRKLILKILKLLDDSLDEKDLDLKLFSPEALGVSKCRLYYALEMMTDNGLVRDVGFVPDGNSRVSASVLIDNMKITVKGLEYLDENTTIAKIVKAAKFLKDTIPMI